MLVKLTTRIRLRSYIGKYLDKKFQIRTPYNYLLINLALAELVIASVGVTFDLNSLLNHGWSFGVNVCNVSGLIVTTSGMKFFEIHFLCAASVKFSNPHTRIIPNILI